MIPFPFNENRFSFFVADHLLVGQLYTNPKSDRSLLSCLKVTQCSISEIGDVPDPSYDNRTIASKMQILIATNNGDVPRVMKIKFLVTVMVFGVVSSKSHIMPPHIFKVGLEVNTNVFLDVLKSVVISRCNQVAEPAGLLHLVIHWEHHQHDLPQHQSQSDRRHPPSICRAPSGACGKGMLPVPDPY